MGNDLTMDFSRVLQDVETQPATSDGKGFYCHSEERSDEESLLDCQSKRDSSPAEAGSE
jgi:hypothetical protein